MPVVNDDSEKHWFVMRDLTRPNAKMPAYKMLEELGVRCFTPMTRRIVIRKGKRERREIPFIHDLVFVHDTRSTLDPIVGNVPTLQYRFLRNANRSPMTVRDRDMENFINAVHSTETPHYYRPDELGKEMFNRRIRIIGGRLDGYEGYLLTTRGSRDKRLLVELPSLLFAAVEVQPEYIELIQ